MSFITIPDTVTQIDDKAFGYYSENWIDKKLGDFTIYGYKGTAAETYDINNGFTFIALEAVKPIFIGDVDGNKKIEINDATWIQRQIASMNLPFTFVIKRADIDSDGEITPMDATAIQYYLANMKTPYRIGEPIQ